MIQVVQKYEKNGFSVLNSVESHGSLIQISKYVSDIKRNDLCKLMQTFTESQTVSHLFENITVKIRFI